MFGLAESNHVVLDCVSISDHRGQSAPDPPQNEQNTVVLYETQLMFVQESRAFKSLCVSALSSFAASD